MVSYEIRPVDRVVLLNNCFASYCEVVFTEATNFRDESRTAVIDFRCAGARIDPGGANHARLSDQLFPFVRLRGSKERLEWTEDDRRQHEPNHHRADENHAGGQPKVLHAQEAGHPAEDGREAQHTGLRHPLDTHRVEEIVALPFGTLEVDEVKKVSD